MKKLTMPLLITVLIILMGYVSSCSTSSMVTAKSGAQIWGENCIRCHNAPSPETFSDVDWDVATKHMEIRANLTPSEAQKVKAFLQSAN